MLERKPFSELVVVRLGEFFAERSSWFRGLWDVGTVQTLSELLELAAVTPAVVSQEALEWYVTDVEGALAKDQGLSRRQLLEIRNLLKNGLPPGALDVLRRLTEEVDDGYLARWAEQIAARPESTPAAIGPERTARAIATHLLGQGFSSTFLHRWLGYRTKHEARVWTLAELVAAADALVKEPQREFKVLVPVNGAIDPRQAPPEWCEAPQVRRWLLQQHLAPVHQGGGWLLGVQARDKYAAVSSACEHIDRLFARLRIGAQKVMRDLGMAFVEGDRDRFQLRAQRRLEVASIQRQAQLFEHDGKRPSRVDAAFELLAQMDGPQVVAVGTSWAAIEALLVAPGDRNKIAAAERMAYLVACSFPRAELSLLASRQLKEPSGPLHESLSRCTTNRERAQVMLDGLRSKTELCWADPEQQAAVARLRVLIEKPDAGLRDVLAHANRVFRRLYRQRNLVLHGGRTQSAVLGATLRTAAPLLGAGLDRIAHAWFVRGVEPLELAATARMRVDIAKEDAAPDLVELLE